MPETEVLEVVIVEKSSLPSAVTHRHSIPLSTLRYSDSFFKTLTDSTSDCLHLYLPLPQHIHNFQSTETQDWTAVW